MTDTGPVDDDGNDLTVKSTTAVLDPTASTLTVSTEMSKATQYAAEKKAISAYLKVALPDSCIIADGGGIPVINPAFTVALDEIAKQLLNLTEATVARHHGLTVGSDDAGVVRVINLFPGATAGPAATAPQGPFVAPVPAAAPMVAPAPVPAAVAPQPGAFPAPAPMPQQQGGGQYPKSTNPNAWSNQTPEMQQQMAAAIEAWITTGGNNGTVQNRMIAGERYPGVTIGQVKIGAKTLANNSLIGPATKAWVQQCVAAGISLG